MPNTHLWRTITGDRALSRSCLWWNNSWYARMRVVARLKRAMDYLQHGVPHTMRNQEAIQLVDAARRAVKYDHGIVYAGGLKKYRPIRKSKGGN